MRPLAACRLLLRPSSISRPTTRRVSTLLQRLGLDNEDPSALTHIHLTSDKPTCHPSYATAAALQNELRQAFLSHKSAYSASSTNSPSQPPPPPFVLSFTPTPTYTLGRRQGPLAPDQASRLRRPLRVATDETPSSSSSSTTHVPETVQTDRGGLTTYHGPGQIVLWPILDIHSAHHKRFTVRSYARLLEETTQAVLARFRIPSYLSEADPGVWIGKAQPAADDASGQQECKVAALGVHLRRHITGLGVALNIDIAVSGDEDVNPWARFVPCGLEGKKVTSIRDQVGPGAWATLVGHYRNVGALRDDIARLWALEFGLRLGAKPGSFVSVRAADDP